MLKKILWTILPTGFTYVSFIFVDMGTAFQRMYEIFGNSMTAIVASFLVFFGSYFLYSLYESRQEGKMIVRALIYLNFIRQTRERTRPAESESGRQSLVSMQKKEQELIRLFLLNNFPNCTSKQASKISNMFFINPTSFVVI